MPPSDDDRSAKAGSDRPANCWEVKKCGREPGGRKAAEQGVCPAAVDESAHGINHGVNGGRYCWKTSGTFCNNSVQNDLEAKRINCMLCDFYKQVMKEEGESFKGVDEEHTEDLHKITTYLTTALEEEKLLEIALDDKVRTFFSRIMDHPPDLLPKTDEEGNQLLDEENNPIFTEPFYSPGTYLHGRTHLLLQPMTPSLGNAQIRSSKAVRIRFFEGTKAFETTVTFQKTITVREEPAIMLDFPHGMSISRKRAHFRVSVPEYVTLSVGVVAEKQGFLPATVRLMDISPGGLSWCHQEPEPEVVDVTKKQEKKKPEPVFQSGDPVRITIQPKELPGLTINGFVRSKATSNERVCRGRNRVVCGVQFDIQDRILENKLLEVVSYFQRILAQATSESRRAKQKQENYREPDGKNLAAQQLLNEKGKFSQTLKRIVS